MSDQAYLIREAVAERIVELSDQRLINLMLGFPEVERANVELLRMTGVRRFFPDQAAFRQFREVLKSPSGEETQREYGDYQTPAQLADKVCAYLRSRGLEPEVIIEPTYGGGSFVLAALNHFPEARLIYGVEIQERYEWQLKISLLIRALLGRHPTAEVELHCDDIFTHVFSANRTEAKSILILGNPPWITSAELSSLQSSNLPTKTNLKSLNGLDAITGKSNFDIGEYVVLRLLDAFAERGGTLALLCKNTIIRNVVELLPRRDYKLANMEALTFDAGREFGVAVEASLFVAELGAQTRSFTCRVSSLQNPSVQVREFGWVNQRFVSHVADYANTCEIEGKSPLVWRQGVKHDCAKVMELHHANGVWTNGWGETVEVEDDRVYWLLKGSDLQAFEVTQARKMVIVTQRSLGEDTAALAATAPRLWSYLTNHGSEFAKRKSSIYRDRAQFAMFGVGDYSFAPYKVAIAGFYKEPRFALVVPIDDRPVMLDDTAYFLGFDQYRDALFACTLLNCSIVQRFLKSITFSDAKRPYTKDALMRIDVRKVVEQVSFQTMETIWRDSGYEPREAICEADFASFRRQLQPIESLRPLPQPVLAFSS